MDTFDEITKCENSCVKSGRRVLVIAAIAFVALLIVIGLSHAKGEALPVQRPPLGVTASAEEIELGRFMFFNKSLSTTGTHSCATCHDPRKGWSDGQPVAIGILGQAGTRNTPTLVNVGYGDLMFWDGRTISTTAQALLPISNPIEMGRQTEQQVVARLNGDAEVVARFARVYGIDRQTGRAVTGIRLARSLAGFQSGLTSAMAPIDRYRDGDKNALTADAKIGLTIFEKSGCMQCHPPPLYTTNGFANNGSEFAGKPRITDQGRFGVVSSGRGRETVRAFKIPTLREITRTAPYMHAGQYSTLERVVAHYNAGGANYQGQRDSFIDPRIKKLGLSESEGQYLVVFLKEAFAGAEYPMIEEP
jgi:cytochrome c peroxidase